MCCDASLFLAYFFILETDIVSVSAARETFGRGRYMASAERSALAVTADMSRAVPNEGTAVH